MENKLLVEGHQIKAVVAPGTDMNTAAITGARVGLKAFDKVTVLVDMGSSTAAVVEMTLKQHNASSGGTSKVLSSAAPHFHKVSPADIFTKVEVSSARSLVDLSALFASAAGMVAIEIKSEELDVNGGFNWFSVDFADSTAAKLIAAYYLLGDARLLPAFDVATV
jgi:hypothetical protein